MAIYLGFLFLIIGATYGSFLNMLLWRLPQGLTLGGRSQCPKCKAQIAWYDLVPILSYLILRGRCRACQGNIDRRYWLVEASAGAASLLFGFFAAPDLSMAGAIVGIYMTLTLISLLFFDLFYMILPD